MEKEEIIKESIKHLDELSKTMNTYIFERKRADFMDGLRFALKRMNTPPNLDNLLEVASKEADINFKLEKGSRINQILLRKAWNDGAKFIVEYLKKELK